MDIKVYDEAPDRSFSARVIRKIKKILNRTGNKKQCYVCKTKFSYFSKFRGGWAKAPILFRELDLIGSDFDNYGCYFCGAKDRLRHLYMFFDKLNMWDKLKNASIIHFAPEAMLSKKLKEMSPNYIKADLNPKDESTQKIDATAIPHKDNTFDFIVFNHILEHIPDYKKALSELYRVLKPNGVAILQTPYSAVLQHNFQDEGINTDRLRFIVYGQEDHVRLFSEKEFLQSIKDAGFKLDIIKHSDFFNDHDAYYYGVNKREDLIKVSKIAS